MSASGLVLDKTIINLIQDGVSLIPVDADNKRPFSKWKEQKTLDEVALADDMFKHKTNAVAIRLGSKSRGLVCLDVDTKHYLGFDVDLFTEIKSMFPEWFKKFRVEKTPSGGYHILYRISDWDGKDLGGCNLASRLSTDEELNIRPDLKQRCFLEFKGEGNLTQCVPSPNYSLTKPADFFYISGKFFSELTYNEHCSLIALCRTFNKIVKRDAALPVTVTVSDFYSENPYEHFNASEDGAKVLYDEGWRVLYKAGEYVKYAKPSRGDKEKDVDASFSYKTRLYTVWTTTTDIEPKSYSPSNLLCLLKFKNDKKQLFAWLVSNGYGKIKPAIERNIIKKIARYGGALPSNISESAKTEYESERDKFTEKYPYGVFWLEGDEGGYKISREDFLSVSFDIGFRFHDNKVCFIDGYIVKFVDDNFYYNTMKDYIKEDNIDLLSCYEAFLQNSGKFMITRLTPLDKAEVLKSTKKQSYKFFTNCYVAISAEDIEILKYSELDKLIWEHSIQKRDFIRCSEKDWMGGLYCQFLSLAISGGVSDYLKRCIGYYSHEHRDEEGYWIIATESCEDPEDGGGSGKNIFCNLFEQTTTYKPTPASMIRKDNNLLQSWDGQRVFCLGDIPKNFDLIFFKDIITGNAVVNKKYINEYSISIEDMPKIIGSSNYSFDDTDPGIKRRVRAIEFTDFFTKCGGVKKHFGKMFPKDWDSQEFLYFDNFIMSCIQEYFKADNIIDKSDLTSGGWSKQFEQKYHHLYEFFNSSIEGWINYGIGINIGKVKNDKFKDDYKTFCDENNINKQYTYTMNKINKALESYCKHFGIGFDKDCVWKENNITFRGKYFFKGANVSVKDENDNTPF
jgi:hypothetical protein